MTRRQLLALSASLLPLACGSQEKASAPGPLKSRKPERIAGFVRELLPKLEAMDIVERYAWFHGGVSGGPLASSKLFNADGSLTVVGEACRSVG